MTIQRLRPDPDRPLTTPQCCELVDAPTHNGAWRKERYEQRKDRVPEGWRYTQCQRTSSLLINGKHYCRLHAGQLALKKWLNGELAETADATRC